MRPAHAVAEHHVQSERRLVDEVVHVRLMAAIVIAHEDDALLAVDGHPARKMNRLHPRQEAAREHMPAGELNRGQHHGHESAAERAGLRRAERGVLIRHIEVFQAQQFMQQRGIWTRTDLGIPIFVRPQRDQHEWRDQEQHGRCDQRDEHARRQIRQLGE